MKELSFAAKALKGRTFRSVDRIERCISTGLPSVDIISGMDKDGRYGIPCGSLVTVYGNPSDGKTTFALGIAKSAQEGGSGPPLEVLYQNTDGMLTQDYMSKQGVDIPKALYSEPQTLEEAFDVSIALLKAAKEQGVSVLIILDSISASPTNAEMELDSLGDSASMGSHARITSRAMRVLCGLLRSTGSVYIIIAQSKSSMQMYVPDTFLSAKPLIFHSTLVYEVRRSGWIKRGNENVGMNVRIRTRKNKVGPPMRATKPIEFYFDSGFDAFHSLTLALQEKGLIERSGLTYNYIGKNKALDGVKFTLRSRNLGKKVLKDLFNEINH